MPACTGSGCPTAQFNGLGGNWIVGVTSYGPTGTVGYLGASQFDSNFLSQYQKLAASSEWQLLMPRKLEVKRPVLRRALRFAGTTIDDESRRTPPLKS